jgi:heterogeneous nuclear ribonucleoprotein U-like protein 1
MLIGLACSGKTRWAKEYVTANAEKNYIILGTSTVVERSVRDPSIITAPKAPKAYESFMNRAGKFVEKLVDMAPSRRRNYILDQVRLCYSNDQNRLHLYYNLRHNFIGQLL